MTSELRGHTKPRRLLDWRERSNGQVVIFRPKFGHGVVGRWLASCLADPHYRIRLDDVGAFVWKACDGSTTLLTIAEGMRAKFGSDVEPVERRLAQFVRRMLLSRILELDQRERPVEKTDN
jgi:hypothetical protein